MKSMLLKKLSSTLELENVTIPLCKDGELLIKVHSTGLNFADTLLISGDYQEKPPLPFSPGMEFSGTVVKVGSEVSEFSVDDRVVGLTTYGGLSEFVAVDKKRCLLIPKTMPDNDAAGFFIPYATSEMALNYRAKLQSGETLLVLGAASSVGITAIQIGKVMGAFVIAVARGEKKCKIAERSGADLVVDSLKTDLKSYLKKKGGVDVIYDPVGGPDFRNALSSSNPEARILPIGFASGEVPLIPANIVMVKNITVIGFYWGKYIKYKPQVLSESLQRLLDLYNKSLLKPHISLVLPLERANEGIQLIKKRKISGKIIIKVS